MKIGVYMLRDAKANAFLSQPIMAPTPGMAERQFLDLLRKEGSFFGQHQGDFSLWEVGCFDDQSGAIVGVSPREFLTGPAVLSLLREA